MSAGGEAASEGSRRRALVLGAAGQDGSYLCELLVEKDYDVTGVVRRSPSGPLPNLENIRDRIRIVQADLADFDAVGKEIRELQPAEIYNFASESFAPAAWRDPLQTVEVGTVAVCRLLETLRTECAGARLFQASSAWVFGRPAVSPQTELTPYAPVEPYGAARAYAGFLLNAYRERDGLFACSGIFYNHESPRRSEQFVTRKITKTAASIKLGLERELILGQVDAKRDWGYAKDYVQAAWQMLQAERPDDYVVATGEAHTVREFAEVAFSAVDLDWRDYTAFDPGLERRSRGVENLVGDASVARARLGWRPSVTFKELVGLMVAADLTELSRAR